MMAETLVHFLMPVTTADGRSYEAQACGAQTDTGLWHAWIEFTPLNGGPKVRTDRETTQPNRTDTRYWALGLTQVYLQGALERALRGRVKLVRTRRSPRGYHIIDRRERRGARRT